MDEMQNFTSEINNQKPNSCLKWCLVGFIGMVVLIAFAIPGVEIIDHIPRTIDNQNHEKYIIELKATSSPMWPFGPQNGRVVLKENKKTISTIDFLLSNDGKNMDYSNWKVDWKNDKVIVTIIGEEQKKETYYLYYNGEICNMTSGSPY